MNANDAAARYRDVAAYPHQELNDDGTHHFTHSGLTKREIAAFMAMQGLCACTGFPTQAIADESVRQADALIAALSQGEDQ